MFFSGPGDGGIDIRCEVRGFLFHFHLIIQCKNWVANNIGNLFDIYIYIYIYILHFTYLLSIYL